MYKIVNGYALLYLRRCISLNWDWLDMHITKCRRAITQASTLFLFLLCKYEKVSLSANAEEQVITIQF